MKKTPGEQASRQLHDDAQASSRGPLEERSLQARLRFQRASEQNPRQLPRPTPDILPWRSRGYLPHFDAPGRVQSVTFRLVDSLPRGFLDKCERALAGMPAEERQVEIERRIAGMLDRGHGKCHLADPRAAKAVEDALLFFDTERYRLLCWCVMPNHVHAMMETLPPYSLSEVLHSWKFYTSKKINRILHRQGRFWQAEYHDRVVRDDDHYANTFRYIEANPVKAGLVDDAEDWRWSSAWQGRR